MVFRVRVQLSQYSGGVWVEIMSSQLDLTCTFIASCYSTRQLLAGLSLDLGQ